MTIVAKTVGELSEKLRELINTNVINRECGWHGWDDESIIIHDSNVFISPSAAREAAGVVREAQLDQGHLNT